MHSPRVIRELYKASAHTYGNNVLADIALMTWRCATNPLDRVAGLFFILFRSLCRTNRVIVRIPKYDESLTEEEAWARLLHCGLRNQCLDGSSADNIAAQLLRCPSYSPTEHWFPTWQQVQAMYPPAGQWFPTLEQARDRALYDLFHRDTHTQLIGPIPNAQSIDKLFHLTPKFDFSIQVVGGQYYKNFEIECHYLPLQFSTATRRFSTHHHHYILKNFVVVDPLEKQDKRLAKRFKQEDLALDIIPIGIYNHPYLQRLLSMPKEHSLRILVIGIYDYKAGLDKPPQDASVWSRVRFLVCKDVTSSRPNQGRHPRTYWKVIACFKCRPPEYRPDNPSQTFQHMVNEDTRIRHMLNGLKIKPEDRIYLE